MQKKYSVRLLKKEKIARDTLLFVFEKPEGYEFAAGQYQTVFLPLQNGQIDSRDMTIASSPFAKELWIVTKIEEKHSEFKDVLQKLSIGSAIQLQGPAGGFTLREEETQPYVFLAGGIGVTVFHSLMLEAAEKDLHNSLTLFASFTKQEDVVWYDELKKVENKYRKVIYTLTQDKTWQEENGRISENLIKKYIKDPSTNIFMIAGGQEMVDDTQAMLLRIGAPEENIRIDYFTGY